MRRRRFLTGAAALAPAAALQNLMATLAHAQAPAASAAVHVVGSGEDRFGSPHSLGFSSIAFKVGTAETGGGLFVMEHAHLRPGGPPLHVHPYQEEWFYVMEGEVAFQVGDQQVKLGAGASVLAPRAVPHTFSSVVESSRMLIGFCPAGKMEQYFRDAEQNTAAAATPEFMERYDVKYVGPSPFWKK